MNEIEIFLGLLAIMAVLLGLAQKMKVPYPILLVLGGLVIGLIPGLPTVELRPELVFILFLPPIIQYAAFLTPIRDFRRNLRSIGLLAVGLVLFTTVLVAVVAHFIIPGMPWPAAFVLGAIVAPPDAAAATSIASRLRLPQRIVTVLEGESLVNDATSLVAYRVAIVAVVSGSFSFGDAGLRFVIAALGGVLIGLAVGWIVMRLTPFIPDNAALLITSFLAGYVAYLIADQINIGYFFSVQINASGVIAVVATGIFIGRAWRRLDKDVLPPQTRLHIEFFWETIISLLNGIIFILIGLQLPVVVKGLTTIPVFDLIWYALAICLATIVTRLIWVPFATYVPRLLFPALRKREMAPQFSWVAIISWTGMRGVVSLASALAIPLTTDNNTPFPGRDLIIFLTFCVILATLVVQGLSLPYIIRILHIVDDGGQEHEGVKARLVAAKAGRAYLETQLNEGKIGTELLANMIHRYDKRIRRYSARYQGTEDTTIEDWVTTIFHLQQDLLNVEYASIIELRDKGVINDQILSEVEREINLERMRLDSDHNEAEHVAREAARAAASVEVVPASVEVVSSRAS